MGMIYRNNVSYGSETRVELTQAEYDALTPAEKMNGTVYFITDGEPSILSDYQTKEDNTLATSNKTVVGGINEVNSLINTMSTTVSGLSSNKQDKNDSTLATINKTVVGAINELNSGKQNAVNSLMIGRGNLPAGTNLRNVYNSGTYYLSGTYSGSPTGQNMDGIMEVYSSVVSGYSAYFHQRLLWINTSNKMVIAERLVINDSDKGWKVIWTEQ